MFGLGRQEDKVRLRRILIVEDEPLIAFDTEHLLHESGFTVVATIDNAPEAEAYITEGGIDLVTADINIRGEGSGVDVARAAHASGIAVLFVSANCPTDARGFAAGCLAKPFAPRDLLSAIAAIERKRGGQRVGRLPRGFTLFEG